MTSVRRPATSEADRFALLYRRIGATSLVLGIGGFVNIVVPAERDYRLKDEFQFVSTGVVFGGASAVAFAVGLLLLARRPTAALRRTGVAVASLSWFFLGFSAWNPDNAGTPIPVALSVGVLIMALLVSVILRQGSGRGQLGQVAVALLWVLTALHLVGAAFIVLAAGSCEDDDCTPFPLFCSFAVVGLVWMLVGTSGGSRSTPFWSSLTSSLRDPSGASSSGRVRRTP